MMLALWTALACIPVEGDHILARDLASAVPAIGMWPPDTDLGYTPAPGLRRVLRAGELDRLAIAAGMHPGSLPDICIERPTVSLTPGILQSALSRAAGDPAARIEILDWSRYRVPPGPLEFPRFAAIPQGNGPGSPILWKGFVRYGERGRFSIWVRTRIQVPASQVNARDDLAAGRPIGAAQITLENVMLSPIGAQPVRSLAEVVGRLPRRAIPSGSPIFASQLEDPLEIHGGDAVTVLVTSGRASLKLVGIAGGDGRRGDIIPVKNPASGRTFRARVLGAGKVAVVVPGLPGPLSGEP